MIHWKDIYKCNNANEEFNMFLQIFVDCVNQVLPKVTYHQTINKTNNHKKEWMDKECFLSRDHVKHCFTQQKNNPSNLKFESLYVEAKKKHITLLQSKKKTFNTQKILSSENISKSTWDVIKNNTLSNRKDKHYINEIKYNKTFHNPSQIAECFSSYFASYTQTLKLNSNLTRKDLKNLNTPSTNSLYFEEITEKEILDIIKNLKNSSSTDVYDLNSTIVKIAARHISKPLKHIFSRCLEEGIFPNKLKTSKIVPIYKKGDPKDIINYRPIAILPIFSKIFEKVIHKRLVKFFDKYSLFSKNQHGFRRNKSTKTATFEVYQELLEHLNNNMISISVFLDLSKAFDCVNHKLLLYKLQHWGIRGNTLNLLKSYLEDREIIVQINSSNGIALSSAKHITEGVPQGSILGPLLYLIYTNDFTVSMEGIASTMYADDTSMQICSTNAHNAIPTVLEVIEHATEWFSSNDLIINKDKTKLLHCAPSNSAKYHSNILTLKNSLPFEFPESLNFLGLILDYNLKWSSHIDALAKKLSKAVFALRIIHQNCSKAAALTLYYGLIYSKLNYGIIFWGQASSLLLSRIFRLQKRAVRIINNLKPSESCRPYFIKDKLLTLPCIYILNILIFVKENFQYYKHHLVTHGHHTRQSNSLMPIQHNMSSYSKGPLYVGIKYYNKLPEKFKTLNNTRFKSKIKKILQKKAYYDLKEFIADNQVFFC